MRIRKELWFGFSLMAIILIAVVIFTPWSSFIDGHLSHEDLGALGLLMLALIVVAIMLGFPTAFTLMGMGVFFGWLAYRSVNPALANQQILDLMVQRAYSVMSNDVLIAIPLFVFMGYLVERANLIEKLFKSLHLSLARVPGALAVATIVTCAIFATATGIVGAVVTLMGLLALPGDAARRLQRAAVGGRDHRRRLPRHPDPAVGAPDRLRRDGRRFGCQAVRRRVLPRHHAGGAVRPLRHRRRQAEAASRAAAERERAAGRRCRRSREQLSAGHRNALAGLFGASADAGAARERSVAGQLFVSLLPAIVDRRAARPDVRRGDGAARGGRHDRARAVGRRPSARKSRSDFRNRLSEPLGRRLEGA